MYVCILVYMCVCVCMYVQNTENNSFCILVDYCLVLAEPSKEKIRTFGSHIGRMRFYESHNAYQRFTSPHQLFGFLLVACCILSEVQTYPLSKI
jgi:hypothetical protein